jgi:hypothetical protein
MMARDTVILSLGEFRLAYRREVKWFPMFTRVKHPWVIRQWIGKLYIELPRGGRS